MLQIEQAFASDFIAQAFGLPIAHENANYEPTQGTPWVGLRVFQNALSAGDLSADAEVTETSGLFQFSLHYPQGKGAITAKTQAQTIFAAYPVGRRISYGGETVKVTGYQLFDATPRDGWFVVVGRITYELE